MTRWGSALIAAEVCERREMLSALTWSAGVDLPVGRADAEAVLRGTTVYLLGGSSSGTATAVQTLAAGGSAWGSAPNIDIVRVGLGAGVTASGQIVLFGGSSGAATDETLRYDPFAGDSQDGTKMSVPRAQLGSASDASGLYAIGGLDDNGTVLSSAERYNVAADLWTSIAPLPEARVGLVVVNDGAGHLFAIGGATSSNAATISSSVFRYTIATDAWDAVASLPTAVRDAAAVLASNGRLYVLGGITTDGSVTNTVQSYDFATDSWQTETPLPTAISGASAVSDSLGRILVIGGRDASGQLVPTVSVSQRLNQPDVAPAITSTPVTSGSADQAYSYQVVATGNPQPTFSLVTAPAGMTIDAARGTISWQPTADQVGANAVVVRATNDAGSVDQSFSVNVVLELTPPMAPTDLTVTGTTTSSISLAWTAATNNVAVASYRVFEKYKYGWRNSRTGYRLVAGDLTETSATITGLAVGTTKTYVVAAVDTSGNQSAYSLAVTATTQRAPVFANSFTEAPNVVRVVANHALNFQLLTVGYPAPTFSLVTGPAGLSVDPATGVVTWTPSASDVGDQVAQFSATNDAGTDYLTVTLRVTPDVPVLTYTLNDGTSTYGIAGVPMTIKVIDRSLTPSTFEYVSGPTGVTIDPATGVATWTPTLAQTGNVALTFRATNSAGSADITVRFYVHFTSEPTNVTVLNRTALNPTVTWQAPTPADDITGYKLTVTYKVRSGRITRTYTLNYDTNSTATSAELTNLPGARTYNVSVRAVYAGGILGVNSAAVSFVYAPAIPNLSWTINPTTVIAGQPMTVQFRDFSPTPRTYSLVSGPAGASIDATSGLLTWTPTLAQVGNATFRVRATNSTGPKDVVLTIPVYFTGQAGVSLTPVSGQTFSVTAVPTIGNTFNTDRIVSYKVVIRWTNTNGRGGSSRTLTIPAGGSVNWTAPVRGAVRYTATAQAVDALGHLGAPGAPIYFSVP